MIMFRPILWNHAFLFGTLIRLILAIILPIAFDCTPFKYTDIDYNVVSDAAYNAYKKLSPYKKQTYRYTPLLAIIVSIGYYGNIHILKNCWGRFLFCIFDGFVGLSICMLRCQKRQRSNKRTHSKKKLNDIVHTENVANRKIYDSLWWLYNPLAINISTRGSSESFIILAPVIGTLYITSKHYEVDMLQSMGIKSHTYLSQIHIQALLAGLIHGFSIHTKLYPIIYTSSYMVYFIDQQHKDNPTKREISNIQYIITTFSNQTSLTFLFTSILSFIFFTALGFHYYGSTSLQSSIFYHVKRLDHRHNYSTFWYWIYLLKGSNFSSPFLNISKSLLSITFLFLTFLQFSLFLYISITIACYDLYFALFLQTYIFVIFNRVITAQYFTWYMVLLPLCSESVQWNSKAMKISIALLILSMSNWLGWAYTLEMLGWNTYRYVWVASLFFFGANVNMLRMIFKNWTFYHTFLLKTISNENTNKIRVK